MRKSLSKQYRSEQWFHAALIGFLVITTVASIVAIWRGQRLFIYPAITALLATLIAALFSPAIERCFSYIDFSGLDSSFSSIFDDDRPFTALLFTHIAIIELLYLHTNFNILYFILLLSFVAVFSILILRGNWCLPLFALILLAILFRANIWFSAEIYSKDPRLHTAIVSYMIETGRLIPDGISYYDKYPIADIFGEITSLVLSVSTKRAYFFAITVPAVLAGFIAFPAIRYVLNYRYDGAAVAAVAIVLFSAFHLVESSGPKPQTLSTVYLSVILLLVTTEIRYRRALSVLLFFVMVKTHLLAPLIVVGLLGSYYLVENMLQRIHSGIRFKQGKEQPYLLILALVITTLQQYHFAGNFRLQFYRLLRPFRQGGGAVSFVSNAGSLTTTDVLIQLDPLFLQAGTLLIIAFLTIVVGFLFILNVLSIHDDDVEWDWILTGILLFAGLSAGFFGSSLLRRAASAVSVLVAPMVAFGLAKLIQDRKTIPTGVFIVILLAGVYVGIAHPGVVLSERNNGFKPTLDAAEVESMSFAQGIGEDSYSFSYYASSAYLRRVGDGYFTSNIRSYEHHRSVTEDTLPKYCEEHPKAPFIYRPFYRKYAGTTLPPQADVVYSTSGVRIFSNCGISNR